MAGLASILVQKPLELKPLSIVTWNVNGASTRIKRKRILQYASTMTEDVILLQETHSTTTTQKYWIRSWKDLVGQEGRIIFSHGTSSTNGVAILIKKQMQLKIHHRDTHGRMIAVELQDMDLKIWNIYAPNDGDATFFNFMEKQDVQEKHIVSGDFNAIMDPDLDRKTTSAHHTTTPRITYLKCLMDNGWTDLWRRFNPNERQYTFKRGEYESRLDYIMVTDMMLGNVLEIEIGVPTVSDHAPVAAKVALDVEVQRSPTWRLNRKLLAEKGFDQAVEGSIKATIQNNPGANPNTLWEVIKCGMRGAIMDFSKRVNKEKRRKIEHMEKEIQRQDIWRNTEKANKIRDEMKIELDKQSQERC